MIRFLFDMTGRIPLRVGYAIADFLAWLAGDVVRYRRKVVMQNLRSSFPERSGRELKSTARKFYHYLADYFVETMRLGHMGEREIRERMTFENIGLVNGLIESGKPVALMLGHYGNWEWITSVALHLSPQAAPSQIYHPLENKEADAAFLKIRDRFGSKSVPMADAWRNLAAERGSGKTSICGFIADQAPHTNILLWLDFLNHDTGVYTGPERIARKLGGAMVYCHITRPERGRYSCRFEMISEDVAAEPVFGPTRRYFALLEEDIRAVPHLWLWSHRRWKRPRKE